MSVLQATRLPDRCPATHVLGIGHAAVSSASPRRCSCVRGKALQLAVYTLYDGPADIDWLKTITQRWQDELLRLNR